MPFLTHLIYMDTCSAELLEQAKAAHLTLISYD